jgi:threonine synthase
VRYSYATHLECSVSADTYDIGKLQGLSAAKKPLLARYDLEALRREVRREQIIARPAELWRWHELLPLKDPAWIVSLGEVETPLVTLTNSRRPVGFLPPMVKDEARLPTGSFKARGLAVAVAMAKAHGVRRVAIPTNGNAGAAMAAYAARAGLEAYCFCPDDTPEINLAEIALQGAAVWRVKGLINDCARLVELGKSRFGWFDMSTLKEPYRIEGKKTMGLELAAQTDWQLPDVVFYPTGGGTGLIGMWKAWAELLALGWISPPLPRLVAVQSSGCAPIVRAFDLGASTATPWENARTIAAGIRVPGALGDFLILRALRESGGFALAVADSAIEAARQEVAARDGLLLSPEGAATYAAYLDAAGAGRVRASDRVVLFNCASGLKYPMPAVTARMDVSSPFAGESPLKPPRS